MNKNNLLFVFVVSTIIISAVVTAGVLSLSTSTPKIIWNKTFSPKNPLQGGNVVAYIVDPERIQVVSSFYGDSSSSFQKSKNKYLDRVKEQGETILLDSTLGEEIFVVPRVVPQIVQEDFSTQKEGITGGIGFPESQSLHPLQAISLNFGIVLWQSAQLGCDLNVIRSFRLFCPKTSLSSVSLGSFSSSSSCNTNQQLFAAVENAETQMNSLYVLDDVDGGIISNTTIPDCETVLSDIHFSSCGKDSVCVVMVCNSLRGQGSYVLALTATNNPIGKVVWKSSLQQNLFGPQTILVSNDSSASSPLKTIFVLREGTEIYAISSNNGNIKWKNSKHSYVSMKLSSSGKNNKEEVLLFATSAIGEVVAIDPKSGLEKWRHGFCSSTSLNSQIILEVDPPLLPQPNQTASHSTGTLFVAVSCSSSNAAQVYSLSSTDGTILWSFSKVNPSLALNITYLYFAVGKNNLVVAGTNINIETGYPQLVSMDKTSGTAKYLLDNSLFSRFVSFNGVKFSGNDNNNGEDDDVIVLYQNAATGTQHVSVYQV